MEYVKEEDIKVNFGLAPGDKLFYCPYNRSHQVLEFKAGRHLETCRRSYLQSSGGIRGVGRYGNDNHNDRIVQCRWRPSKHHLPQSQMSDHEKICEGNAEKLLEQFSSYAQLPPGPHSLMNADEEDNWEDC